MNGKVVLFPMKELCDQGHKDLDSGKKNTSNLRG